MAYVIAEPCIGVKDAECVDACPVDCIQPTRDSPAFEEVLQLFIDPKDCIDCGVCVSVCPVSAIYALDELPEKWSEFAAINATYYPSQEEIVAARAVRDRRLAASEAARQEIAARVDAGFMELEERVREFVYDSGLSSPHCGPDRTATRSQWAFDGYDVGSGEPGMFVEETEEQIIETFRTFIQYCGGEDDSVRWKVTMVIDAYRSGLLRWDQFVSSLQSALRRQSLTWIGPIEELISGDSDYAKQTRQGFRRDSEAAGDSPESGPLLEDEIDEFLATIQDFRSI